MADLAAAADTTVITTTSGIGGDKFGRATHIRQQRIETVLRTERHASDRCDDDGWNDELARFGPIVDDQASPRHDLFLHRQTVETMKLKPGPLAMSAMTFIVAAFVVVTELGHTAVLIVALAAMLAVARSFYNYLCRVWPKD